LSPDVEPKRRQDPPSLKLWRTGGMSVAP